MNKYPHDIQEERPSRPFKILFSHIHLHVFVSLPCEQPSKEIRNKKNKNKLWNKDWNLLLWRLKPMTTGPFRQLRQAGNDTMIEYESACLHRAETISAGYGFGPGLLALDLFSQVLHGNTSPTAKSSVPLFVKRLPPCLSLREKRNRSQRKKASVLLWALRQV